MLNGGLDSSVFSVSKTALCSTVTVLGPSWSLRPILHFKDEETKGNKMQWFFKGSAEPGCQVGRLPDHVRRVTRSFKNNHCCFNSISTCCFSFRKREAINFSFIKAAFLVSEPCFLLTAAVYTTKAKCGTQAPFCLNPINRHA